MPKTFLDKDDIDALQAKPIKWAEWECANRMYILPIEEDNHGSIQVDYFPAENKYEAVILKRTGESSEEYIFTKQFKPTDSFIEKVCKLIKKHEMNSYACPETKRNTK